MQDVRFNKLSIHTKLNACAHSCKYCLMGDKKLARLPVERIAAFLERFLEWEHGSNKGPHVSYIINYTSDYDRRTLELIKDLDARYPRPYGPLSGITPRRPALAARNGTPRMADGTTRIRMQNGTRVSCRHGIRP